MSTVVAPKWLYYTLSELISLPLDCSTEGHSTETSELFLLWIASSWNGRTASEPGELLEQHSLSHSFSWHLFTAQDSIPICAAIWCSPEALPRAGGVQDAHAEVATLSNYTGLCENSHLHCGAQGRAQGRFVRRYEQVWGHRSLKVLQEAGTRLRMQSGPRVTQGHQYNQLWLAHFTSPGIWISHNSQEHNAPVLCDKLKQFKWDFV